jgi:hypothetical protein
VQLPCPKHAQAGRAWRLVDPDPLRTAAQLTCGICHPPPFPLVCFLDTRAEGFLRRSLGGGTVRVLIEWT